MNLQEVLERFDDLSEKLDNCLTDELLDARRLVEALVEASESDFLDDVKNASEHDKEKRGFSAIQLSYRNYALSLHEVAKNNEFRIMLKNRFEELITEYVNSIQTVLNEFSDTALINND